MTENPDDWALRELAKHQALSGIAFENPEAPVGPSGSGMEGLL